MGWGMLYPHIYIREWVGACYTLTYILENGLGHAMMEFVQNNGKIL